ncbi:MAG TPA: universal stress protein [Candidatus Methylomirabilis sp.]|nr:universal stress protein [Candidatus Methylomirabilis sp.]
MRILLGFNGSELSKEALRAVIREHQPEKTRVKVLYLVPVDEWDGKGSQPRLLVEGAGRELAKAGFKVETEVMKGTSSGSICEAAEAWKADLIVLGWHGRSTIERMLYGSVPYAVVHHAPCSVELVRTRQHSAAAEAPANASGEQSVAH